MASANAVRARSVSEGRDSTLAYASGSDGPGDCSRLNAQGPLMQDLLLWRLLLAPTFQVEAGTPLVEPLADLPLYQRPPFLGLLPRLLKPPDMRLRAAAVLALREASGPLAFRQILAALDDPEPSVRRAAVEALRKSAAHDA